MVLGVLVLQQMHDTTDPQTLEMLAFNEQWHYGALMCGQEDEAYLCDKTLRNWRNRLIAQGLEKELFGKVTAGLAKHYKVDPSLQRIDSTRVCSNMARLSRPEFNGRDDRDVSQSPAPGVSAIVADGGRGNCRSPPRSDGVKGVFLRFRVPARRSAICPMRRRIC